uniref:Uncharacterized protein n=1 Tax=Oryza barthii TaxID=65489 RepID=A0A0D3G2Q9_9ORYZ
MPMQTLDKTNAVKAVHSEDNGERTDISESSDAVEWDPWDAPDPPRPPFPPTADFTSKVQLIKQYGFQVRAALAASRSTNIIAPDRTPQVSHRGVLGNISSILKDHGVAPTGKGINIGDLKCCPYDCEESDSVLKCKHEDSGMTKASGESPNRNVEAKNERNARIFQHVSKTLDQPAEDIKEEIAVWGVAGIFSQFRE